MPWRRVAMLLASLIQQGQIFKLFSKTLIPDWTECNKKTKKCTAANADRQRAQEPGY